MRIIGYQFTQSMGYPILRIDTDLGQMVLHREQKLLAFHGVVYTGLEDELPEITVPAIPEIGSRELVLRGFTRDPKVLRIYREFEDWDPQNV